VPLIGLGQSGELKFCSDSVYSDASEVQQTIDGGFAAINWGGGTYPGGSNGPILIKIDANLDTSWTKNDYSYIMNLGGQTWTLNAVTVRSFQQTLDGGYILCGGNADLYLIKTDVNGNQLWGKSFYNICPHPPQMLGITIFNPHVIQTFDGGYMITGTHLCNTNNDRWIFLIKTDSNGVLMWETQLQTLNDAYASDIEQTLDGGYIICGAEDTGWPILLKTDQNGNLLWQFTPTWQGYFSAVEQTTDLGYIVSGGGGGSFLQKVDQNGANLFSVYINLGIPFDVIQSSDGGYLCTGAAANPVDPNYSEMSLIKTDAGGSTIWQKNYDVASFGDYSQGMSVDNIMSGGYIVGGITYGCPTPDNGTANLYIVRTDGNGNITSTFNIPTPSSNRELEKVVDVLGREVNEKRNTPLFYIYNDGTVEKKIIIE